jgi:hypothetical protein
VHINRLVEEYKYEQPVFDVDENEDDGYCEIIIDSAAIDAKTTNPPKISKLPITTKYHD